MKLASAIKVHEVLIKAPILKDDKTCTDALNLGIQALDHIERQRQANPDLAYTLLLGETEEQVRGNTMTIDEAIEIPQTYPPMASPDTSVEFNKAFLLSLEALIFVSINRELWGDTVTFKLPSEIEQHNNDKDADPLL